MKNLQNYPLNIDFTAAVQNPQVCFADEVLRSAQPAKNRARRVLLWSGNFATVYKLLQGSQAWAVRCFTRQPQSDIKQRYAAISDHLNHHKLPYLVQFQFLERGILVHGVWQPILKMDWVEGVDLDVYIGKNINDPKQLLHLERQLQQLRQDLQKAKIAHGDLQHGNVMVTTTGELKLVDYDGMYVPALAEMPPHEMGHPNYQSPWRSEADFHGEMDDFAFDVIALSLRALALDSSLWQQFHEDNKNLLFRQKDFQEPENSPVFQAIANLKDHNKDHGKDRELQHLYQRVWRHCLRETEPEFKFAGFTISNRISEKIPSQWLWLAAGTIFLIIGGALFTMFFLMPNKSTESNSSASGGDGKTGVTKDSGNIKSNGTALKLNRMTLVEQYRAGKRNFGGVNLTGEDLSNLQLSGIELPGAQMERVNLQRTNLSQSNLTGANLHQSNLDKADLTSATITDATITEASLINAQLPQTIALRTNFSQTKLQQTNMQRIDGTGAIFNGADLQNANLSQGNFTLGTFRKSKLIKTNLMGAVLAGAEIIDGNLNHADLTDADLRSITLNNTNLNGANLTNGNLTGASLILVELTGANFTRANLRQINLQNIGSIESANFTEVQFLAPKTRQTLCTLASGIIVETGVSTQASLGCP